MSPGRDVEPSSAGASRPRSPSAWAPTRAVTLSYFHQNDDNIPQYGVPFFSAYGGPLPGIDARTTTTATTTSTRRISSRHAHRHHRARLQRQHDAAQPDALPEGRPAPASWMRRRARGAWRAAPTRADRDGLPPRPAPGTFRPGNPSGPRGYVRDTQNSIAVNQTDLTTHFDTGTIEHALVAGFSISQRNLRPRHRHALPRADGSTPVPLPPMSIADPNHFYDGPRNFTRANVTKGSLDNQSVYVFDTLKFNEQWMVNLGTRWEHNEGDSVVDTHSVVAGPTFGTSTGVTTFENSDNLFSYRASVLFKPVEAGTLYLSYSNSKTPSKASVNGALHRADLQRRSGIGGQHRTRREVGRHQDARRHRRAVPQRSRELQGRRPGQPGQPERRAAARWRSARGRCLARRRGADHARLGDLRQRDLAGQRSAARRVRLRRGHRGRPAQGPADQRHAGTFG